MSSSSTLTSSSIMWKLADNPIILATESPARLRMFKDARIAHTAIGPTKCNHYTRMRATFLPPYFLMTGGYESSPECLLLAYSHQQVLPQEPLLFQFAVLEQESLLLVQEQVSEQVLME